MYEHLTILSGRANPELAKEIAGYLGIGLGHVDAGNFPDGEHARRRGEVARARHLVGGDARRFEL